MLTWTLALKKKAYLIIEIQLIIQKVCISFRLKRNLRLTRYTLCSCIPKTFDNMTQHPNGIWCVCVNKRHVQRLWSSEFFITIEKPLFFNFSPRISLRAFQAFMWVPTTKAGSHSVHRASMHESFELAEQKKRRKTFMLSTFLSSSEWIMTPGLKASQKSS